MSLDSNNNLKSVFFWKNEIKDKLQIYSGILLSRKKRWNTTMCNIMGGARKYRAKWNESE